MGVIYFFSAAPLVMFRGNHANECVITIITIVIIIIVIVVVVIFMESDFACKN